MVALGAASLVLALLAALYAAGSALAGRKGDEGRVAAARRAIYALFGLLTLCVVVLEAAFLRSDFSVELVADHSSTTTPTFYKLTAMWSSQGGSLLLWAWVLSAASSLVLFATRGRHREIVPYATAILGGLAAFFCGLMLFGANPFARLDPAPIEGAGLNPLLRHPAMMIHPPLLYSGYVAFAIPFAFAIGALITRRLGAEWIRSTRRFALVAWALLGIGILLGARWSYVELGWGGYWAWDPVENASLMPWLTGTAFLHSVMVQERRGMLKVWNVSLIVATFTLALLGTFLVRSGVLESIHAFGASTVGGPLLALIAAVLLGSTYLIATRMDELRSPRRVDSLLSRESVFLVNNLLLVGLCAVIFWGTFFPLISEAITGEQASLAAPWFDRYTMPLAIALVLFAGIGPLLAWRRVNARAAVRLLALPAAVALVGAAVLIAFLDAGEKPAAAIMLSLCAFALVALVQEVTRSVRARRSLTGQSAGAALVAIVRRNRRRYGGYAVHAGIVVTLAAIAVSSSFQTSSDLRLRVGESEQVGDYRVTYESATREVAPAEGRLTLGGVLSVERDGSPFARLEPSRNYYAGRGALGVGPVRSFFEGEATSEVARTQAPGGDFWTAMQPDLAPLESAISEGDRRLESLARTLPQDDPEAAANLSFLQGQVIGALADRYVTDPPPANFRVNVNPFVGWIWIGGGIALAGAALALWPARRRRAAIEAATNGHSDPRITELELRKQAKYAEIGDTELDRAAGKLTEADFRRQDAELRREAVEILRELDKARAANETARSSAPIA